MRRIQRGLLHPGDRLPSEAELVREFGVSRITVRRALEGLLQGGWAYSLQGKGSFVAEPHMREISGFGSFSDDIVSRGMHPHSTIVRAEVVDPPTDVTDQLQLAPGERVTLLERVRFADDLPVAFETAYIPKRIASDLLDNDLEEGSLYRILRERYRVFPTWADAQIDAYPADERTAAFLNLRLGSPMLRALRLTYTERFEIIERVVSLYRGDRFTFFSGRQYIA